MKKVMIFVVALLALSAVAFAADPLIYFDFDGDHPATLLQGDQYILDWSERGTSVTAVWTEVYSPADGLEIKVPDGDGVTAPSDEGPQGGKAMVIDSGGKEEGFNVEMSSYYHPGDYTVEVCFWTADQNLAGNTVGLQNIFDSAWPSGDVLHTSLRILGDGGPVGRPADSRHIECVCWQATATNNEVRIVSLAEITAQTWHTAQMVFDYNEGDPANSSFEFYLDGVSQGSATYDAASSITGAEFTHFWGVFGTPATGARAGEGSFRFGLGASLNRTISGIDNRGVQGAIDAFCISEGALTPAEFVLPTGFNPPPPTNAGESWSIYE